MKPDSKIQIQWSQISLEEMKNIGSFKNLKSSFTEDIGFSLPARSWKIFYEKISAIRKIFTSETNDNSINNNLLKNFSWLSIKCESQINDNEKFLKIKEELLKDTGLTDLLIINNTDDLLKTINAFRALAQIQSNEDEFFISKKHRLAFCILKHEGCFLDNELNITKKHYLDNELAKKWRNGLIKIFHPDKNSKTSFKLSEEISQKINKIYKRMVGKA